MKHFSFLFTLHFSHFDLIIRVTFISIILLRVTVILLSLKMIDSKFYLLKTQFHAKTNYNKLSTKIRRYFYDEHNISHAFSDLVHQYRFFVLFYFYKIGLKHINTFNYFITDDNFTLLFNSRMNLYCNYMARK